MEINWQTEKLAHACKLWNLGRDMLRVLKKKMQTLQGSLSKEELVDEWGGGTWWGRHTCLHKHALCSQAERCEGFSNTRLSQRQSDQPWSLKNWLDRSERVNEREREESHMEVLLNQDLFLPLFLKTSLTSRPQCDEEEITLPAEGDSPLQGRPLCETSSDTALINSQLYQATLCLCTSL